MSELFFVVYGTPQPQGSTKAFIPKGWKRPIITSTNAKNKPWRQEVAGVALAEIEKLNVSFVDPFRPLMEGQPVFASMEFFFDRPKSVKCSHKTTKPDLDKLLRSVFDALTGVAFKDDSQVMCVEATKRFGSPARVEIKIGEFPLGAV